MLRRELLQSLLAALASQRSRAPQSKPPARGRGHVLFPVAGAACYGAVNDARSDGALAQGVGYGPNAFFVPELYMLAMTYMYEGDREFGLELASRMVYDSHDPHRRGLEPAEHRPRRHGRPAVLQPLRPEHDAWAVPTALEGKDIATFCAPGGLVDRILKAAARPSARTTA